MKTQTRNGSRHRWAVALASATLLFATTFAAADDGFEVGNAQGFSVKNGFTWPMFNGLYGQKSEKTSGSEWQLVVKTFKDMTYGAFRELRRVLEPRGFENIRVDGVDAMEREGFGHGKGRCNYEIRYLNASQQLVTADYEARRDCTVEEAAKALQDYQQSRALIGIE